MCTTLVYFYCQVMQTWSTSNPPRSGLWSQSSTEITLSLKLPVAVCGIKMRSYLFAYWS